MLVVKCRSGTSVRIGAHVRVTIGQIADGAVRLDIDRPPDMAVCSVAEARLRQLATAAGGKGWDAGRMFALAPKSKPELLIGSDIRVAVLNVSGDAIGLGISAPPSLGIEREDAAPVSLDLSDTLPSPVPHPREPRSGGPRRNRTA